MPYDSGMKLNGLHITRGKQMTTTYTQLLEEVSIKVTLTPNDAEFIAELIKQYTSTFTPSVEQAKNLQSLLRKFVGN